MMPRLIDADALKEYIGCADAVKYGNKTAEQQHNSYSTIMMYEVADYIDDMPTIDAEPVRHGRWTWREDWGHPSISEPPELLDAYWMCSTCGTDLLQYLKSHFTDIPSYTECAYEEMPTLERCPSCGAKMDGGAEE